MGNSNVDFDTLDDLGHLLERIGLKLHARNRIFAGESDYLWHLAETIRKAGRMTSLAEHPDVLDRFGNGFIRSELSEEQKEDQFFDLLRAQET